MKGIQIVYWHSNMGRHILGTGRWFGVKSRRLFAAEVTFGNQSFKQGTHGIEVRINC